VRRIRTFARMKLFPLLVCAAIIALAFPACTSAPKKQECPPASCCVAKGTCEAPAKKHKH